MKKILLIDQIVEDKSINYLDDVRLSLQGFPQELELVHVHLPTQDWLPEYLQEADAILLSGSTKSAYEDFPWKDKAAQVFSEIIASGKPALATCFSAQFLARHLGGEVSANPSGIEFGPIKIELTPEGQTHQLFAPFSADKHLFATHGDCISKLPENCSLLASNSNSSVQAYSCGNILATQFHSDIPVSTARMLLAKRKDLYLEKKLLKDERDFQEMDGRLEKVVESHQFLVGWLEKALG